MTGTPPPIDPQGPSFGNQYGDELFSKSLTDNKLNNVAYRKLAQNVGAVTNEGLIDTVVSDVVGTAAAAGKELGDMALGLGRGAMWVGSGFGAMGDTSWMPSDLYELLPEKSAANLSSRIARAGFAGQAGEMVGMVAGFAGSGGVGSIGKATQALDRLRKGQRALVTAAQAGQGVAKLRVSDFMKYGAQVGVTGAAKALTLPGKVVAGLEKPGAAVGRAISKLPMVREWSRGATALPSIIGASSGFGLYNLATDTSGDRVGAMYHGLFAGAALKATGALANSAEKAMLGVKDPSKLTFVSDAYESLAARQAGYGANVAGGLRAKITNKALQLDQMKKLLGARAVGTAIESMGWAGLDPTVAQAVINGNYAEAAEKWAATIPAALFARTGRVNAYKDWRRAATFDNGFAFRMDLHNKRRRAAGLDEIPYRKSDQLPPGRPDEPDFVVRPGDPEPPQTGPSLDTEVTRDDLLTYSGPPAGPERQIADSDTIYATGPEPARDPRTIDVGYAEPGVTRMQGTEYPRDPVQPEGMAPEQILRPVPGMPLVSDQMVNDPTGYVGDMLLQSGWEIADASEDNLRDDGIVLEIPGTPHRLTIAYSSEDASQLVGITVPADVFDAVRGKGESQGKTVELRNIPEVFEFIADVSGLANMRKMSDEINGGAEEVMAGGPSRDGAGAYSVVGIDGKVYGGTFPISKSNYVPIADTVGSNNDDVQVDPALEPWFAFAKAARNMAEPSVGIDQIEAAILFAAQGNRLSPSHQEMLKALRMLGPNLEMWAADANQKHLEFMGHMLGRLGSGHGRAEDIAPLIAAAKQFDFKFGESITGELSTLPKGYLPGGYESAVARTRPGGQLEAAPTAPSQARASKQAETSKMQPIFGDLGEVTAADAAMHELGQGSLDRRGGAELSAAEAQREATHMENPEYLEWERFRNETFRMYERRAQTSGDVRTREEIQKLVEEEAQQSDEDLTPEEVQDLVDERYEREVEMSRNDLTREEIQQLTADQKQQWLRDNPAPERFIPRPAGTIKVSDIPTDPSTRALAPGEGGLPTMPEMREVIRDEVTARTLVDMLEVYGDMQDAETPPPVAGARRGARRRAFEINLQRLFELNRMLKSRDPVVNEQGELVTSDETFEPILSEEMAARIDDALQQRVKGGRSIDERMQLYAGIFEDLIGRDLLVNLRFDTTTPTQDLFVNAGVREQLLDLRNKRIEDILKYEAENYGEDSPTGGIPEFDLNRIAALMYQPSAGPGAAKQKRKLIKSEFKTAKAKQLAAEKMKERAEQTPEQRKFQMSNTPDWVTKSGIEPTFGQMRSGSLTPQQFANKMFKELQLNDPKKATRWLHANKDWLYQMGLSVPSARIKGAREPLVDALKQSMGPRGGGRQLSESGIKQLRGAIRQVAEMWMDKAGLRYPQRGGVRTKKSQNLLNWVRDAGGLNEQELIRLGVDVFSHKLRFLSAKGLYRRNSKNRFGDLAEAAAEAGYLGPSDVESLGAGGQTHETDFLDAINASLGGAEVIPYTEGEGLQGKETPEMRMKRDLEKVDADLAQFTSELEDRVSQMRQDADNAFVAEQLADKGDYAIPEHKRGEDEMQRRERYERAMNDPMASIGTLVPVSAPAEMKADADFVVEEQFPDDPTMSDYRVYKHQNSAYEITSGKTVGMPLQYGVDRKLGEGHYKRIASGIETLEKARKLVMALTGRPGTGGQKRRQGQPGDPEYGGVEISILADIASSLADRLARVARWASQQRPEIIRKALPDDSMAFELRRANSQRAFYRGQAEAMFKPGLKALSRKMAREKVELQPNDVVEGGAAGSEPVVIPKETWADVVPGLESVHVPRWELVGQYKEGVTPEGADYAVVPASKEEAAWAKASQEALGYLYNMKRLVGGWQGQAGGESEGDREDVRLMQDLPSHFFPRFKGPEHKELMADPELRRVVFEIQANLNPGGATAATREAQYAEQAGKGLGTYNEVDYKTNVESIRRDRVSAAGFRYKGKDYEIRQVNPRQVVLDITRLQGGEVAMTEMFGQDGSKATRAAVQELAEELDVDDPIRGAVLDNLRRGGSENRMASYRRRLQNVKMSAASKEQIEELVKDAMRYASGAGDAPIENANARRLMSAIRTYKGIDSVARSALTVKAPVLDLPEMLTLPFMYAGYKDALKAVVSAFKSAGNLSYFDLVEHYTRQGTITPRLGNLIYEEAVGPLKLAAKGLGYVGEQTEIGKAVISAITADKLLERYKTGKWTLHDSELALELMLPPGMVARLSGGTFTEADARQFRRDYTREVTRRAEQGEGVPMVDSPGMTAAIRFLRFQTEHVNRLIKRWQRVGEATRLAVAGQGDPRAPFVALGRAMEMTAGMTLNSAAGLALGIMVWGVMRWDDEKELHDRLVRQFATRTGWRQIASRAVGGGLPGAALQVVGGANVGESVRVISFADSALGLKDVLYEAIKEFPIGDDKMNVAKYGIHMFIEAARQFHLIPFEADLFNRGIPRLQEEYLAAATGANVSKFRDFQADRDIMFEFLRDSSDETTLGFIKERRPEFERTKLQTFYNTMDEAMELWMRGEAQAKGQGWKDAYAKLQEAVDQQEDVRGAKSVAAYIRNRKATSLIDREQHTAARQFMGDERWHDIITRDAMLDQLALQVGRMEGELPPDYMQRVEGLRETIALGGGDYGRLVEEAIEHAARSISSSGSMKSADFGYIEAIAPVISSNREVFRDVFNSRDGRYVSSDDYIRKYPNYMTEFAKDQLMIRAIAKAKKKIRRQAEQGEDQ